MNAFLRTEQLTRTKRVVPPIPSSKSPQIPFDEDDDVNAERDELSSWSTFIRYVNAKGEESQRRIACHRLEGFGRPEVVRGYCFESKRPKSFRIDRIIELADYTTGEFADPREHFDRLHLHGLLPIDDKQLGELAKVLVFMARCDGTYHPLEEEALEYIFSRYALRFGGSDSDVLHATQRSRALAPDGVDFVRSLRRIANCRDARQLSRLVLDGCASMIDADGRHTPEEVEWAVEVSGVLKQLATS